MKITPQFISDMNICAEAHAWYLTTFGTTDQPYKLVYDQVVNYSGPGDPNGWVNWAKSLQTSLAAITYYHNETYNNIFKLDGPTGIAQQYPTVAECTAAIDTYVTTNITPASVRASVDIQLVTTTPSGTTIANYDNRLVFKNNESLMINTKTVRMTAKSIAELNTVLNNLLIAEQAELRSKFVISQKVSEPVDGFFAWKPLV